MLQNTDFNVSIAGPEASARRLRLAVEAGRMAVWEADFRADVLPPSVALGMSLALHELATNASKYGALSVAGGRVSIAWGHAPGGDSICLEWREDDGPPVLPPAASGFGTKLIERVLAMDGDGGAELDFDPRGVRCVLRGKIVSGEAA